MPKKKNNALRKQPYNFPDESLGSMCANILASQSFALSVRGTDFEPIYVNDSCLELFGETREQWLEDDWERRYQPGQICILYDEAIPAVLRGGKWQGEFGITTPKGEKKQVRTDWDAIVDDQGELICFYGIYTDITEFNELKEKLKRQNKYLNEIIDAFPDPLVVKNQDHQWLLVNQEFCKLLGKNREELLGKNDSNFLTEEETKSVWALDDEVFNTGQEIINEETVVDANGIMRILSSKRVPVTGIDNTSMILAVGRDITTERELQSSIAESYMKLGTSLTALGHDLSRIQDDIADSVSKTGAINALFKKSNTEFASLLKQAELTTSIPSPKKESTPYLSSREYQVFLLLVQGKRIKEIADHLGINPNTASTYRTRVMKKLKISSMADLIQYAIRLGVV